MRFAAIAIALCSATLAVPSAYAEIPWICVDGPKFFACAGEYTWAPDQPECAVTQYYVWAETGTSSAIYGMSCGETYYANGGGVTLANTTAVGARWQTGECFTVFVANYLDHTWTQVPVCDLGEAPDAVPWGHLGP